MSLYRDLAGAQLRGHFLVHHSSRDECHHFMFAGCKRFVAGLQSGCFRAPDECRPIPNKCFFDGTQKVPLAERLWQEVDCPSLHRLDGHWNVALAGDEDDGDMVLGGNELTLQFNSAQARQTDIKYEARGFHRPSPPEELGTGRKRLNPQSDGMDEAAKRLAHRYVVVDDKNNRSALSLRFCSHLHFGASFVIAVIDRRRFQEVNLNSGHPALLATWALTS